MNAKERSERDADLFRGRRQGLGFAVLAATFGITERQCRRIVEAQRKREAGRFDQSAQEHLEEHLDALDALAEDLELEAQAASSPSLKVKALTAKVRVLEARRRALDEAGLLPRCTPRPIESAESLGVAIIQILRDCDVEEAAQSKCMDAICAWAEDRFIRRDAA